MFKYETKVESVRFLKSHNILHVYFIPIHVQNLGICEQRRSLHAHEISI